MKTALLIVDVQERHTNKDDFPRTVQVASAMNDLQDQYETVLISMMRKKCWSEFDSGQSNPSPLAFRAKPGSKIFIKETVSAATAELLAHLRAEQIDNIDVCGLSTDTCVLATAFALHDAGFRVNVRGEHCASDNDRESQGKDTHNNAIYILHRNGMSKHWMSQKQY